MKKAIIVFISALIILYIVPLKSYAKDEEGSIDTESILQSQQESLDISSFLEEADKYTSSVYEEIDINKLFTSALTGKIDNKQLFKSILGKFGKEVVTSIQVLGSIIIIIVIHSILKSISDGLNNKGISQITYYVQYILIITLIMKNFVQILDMIKDSIQNLVGFMNCLIPILMTLIMTTGSIASASMLQPIILFVITFISNFINSIILPLVLVGTALRHYFKNFRQNTSRQIIKIF